MSNRIDIRRWERPDRPQPVYKGALSLWEAPLYAAIAAASLVCSVRPAERPRLDVRVHSTTPADAELIFVNLPAAGAPTVAQTIPAMAQASAGFRSTAAPKLDVRFHFSETNFGVPDDASVAQQAGIWSQAANPGRTTLEAPLDVRTHVWQPPPSWFFTSLPADATVAQRAAVWAQRANPGRTPDRGGDVREIQTEPGFGWVWKVADGAVASWLPIFDAQQASVRTPDHADVDVRTHSWQPPIGWIAATFAVDATVAQRAAVWSQTANPGRTVDHAALESRHSWQAPNGWIVSNVVPDATVAQQAAVWSQQANPGRTGARAGLENRHAWQSPLGWLAATFVQDATVAQQAAVWSQIANPGRTADRLVIEIRHTWQAPNGWEVSTFAPDATVSQQAAIWAQQVNAQYGRTRERGGDVRRIQTEPAFTWAAKVVDGIVALWAPVFDAQASPRTVAQRPLDVRAVSDMPEIAWWSPTLPALTAIPDVTVIVPPFVTTVIVQPFVTTVIA